MKFKIGDKVRFQDQSGFIIEITPTWIRIQLYKPYLGFLYWIVKSNEIRYRKRLKVNLP